MPRSLGSNSNVAIALNPDDNLPGIKLLIDLISERVFWYQQRDTADKKIKKLRVDMKRCQNGEFSSTAEMFDFHSKSAELERAKISLRMTAIDDKLVNATSALWSKLEATTHTFNGSNRHDLTPPPSETSSDINLNIDEKVAQLRDALQTSMRFEITEEFRKLRCEVKDADESRVSTIQTHAAQESQKLAQLRDSLEASMRNQITQESQKLQCEVKDAYESRTATIQNHAMQESQKLAQMRSNLETMVRKQGTEESQKLAQMRSNLETMIRKQGTEESLSLQSKFKDYYEAQLAILEQTLSQEKEVSKSLQENLSHEKDVSKSLQQSLSQEKDVSKILQQSLSQEKDVSKSLQAELESTNARLAALETKVEAISTPPDQPMKQEANMDSETVQNLYLELEAELQDKMMKFLLQSGGRIVPDERVLRLVQPTISAVETNVQSSLKRMAVGFGEMIEKERAMYASLGVQVKAAAQSASASAQAVEGMRAEFAEIQIASDAVCQSKAETVKDQEARIQHLSTSLAWTNSELESARSRLQKSVDALWLRSTNMHAWQENFSTIKLFEAIVQHLNISFMPEHVSSWGTLKSRVMSLESRLGDDGNKKRKLAEHSRLPSPSLARR